MFEILVRVSLWMSFPFNLGAAYVFAMPDSWPGRLLGLPADPHPIYAYMTAMFVGLFGFVYAWLALQKTLLRPFMYLGVVGKGGAFLLGAALWSIGQAVTPVLAAVSVDLVLAVFWYSWLVSTAEVVDA